jgi:hypothetical protein
MFNFFKGHVLLIVANICLNALAFISSLAKVHNNLFWQGLRKD